MNIFTTNYSFSADYLSQWLYHFEKEHGSIHSDVLRDRLDHAQNHGQLEVPKTVFPPAVRTATSIVVRLLQLPITSTFIKLNFTKNEQGQHPNFREAFIRTKTYGLWTGWQYILKGTSLEASALFGSREIFRYMLIENRVSPENAAEISYVPAAMFAAIVNEPNESRHRRAQAGGRSALIENYRYTALPSALLRNIFIWGFGQSIGTHLNREVSKHFGDTNIGFMVSKIIGWVIGNFFASPFYNLTQLTRIYPREIPNMYAGLKHLNIAYNGNYSAENYKVPSVSHRLLLGMPTDPEAKPHISPTEKLRLRVYHMLNMRALWRGYMRSIPGMLIAGGTVAFSERFANKICHNDEK